MEKIKVSIIVSVYNIQEYLQKCIESIINQSYRNIEIILVDDGSTDGSSEICDYYAQVDNRILIIHKENGGVVSARKAGAEIVTGDYVLNIDGDDWIEKNRIDVLVRDGIEPHKADMVYMSGQRRDFGDTSVLLEQDIPLGTYYGDEIKELVFPLLFNIRKAFEMKIYGAMWTWAVKSSLLQEKQRIVDNGIIVGEDSMCIWLCLLSAKSVTLIKENGYHYIQRKSSVTYKSADLDCTESMRIWYHQLKAHLEKCNAFSEEIGQCFINMTIYMIILFNYKLVLERHLNYLYPFPAVKRKSKIIVYGAGKLGYSLMKYLAGVSDYEVILWVDQNEKRPALPGYKISSIESIDKVDYDYIVIALLNANIAKDVKKSLILKGISPQKIETMNPNVITEDAIPNEIRG